MLDDVIDLRRSALALARSVLREVRDGRMPDAHFSSQADINHREAMAEEIAAFKSTVAFYVRI